MRRLIIDADGIIYRFASANEMELPSEDTDPSGLPLWIGLGVNVPATLKQFWGEIESMRDSWCADEVILTITDSAKNFRLDIDPTYKGNRKHTRKPLALKTIKERLIADESAYFKPRLEADDTCGILMGLKRYAKDTNILWSPDKDLDGVPGIHAVVGSLTGETYTVSREEADQWHLLQAVMGDTTDGYPGLPGIGQRRALEHLNEHGFTWESAMDLLDSANEKLPPARKVTEEYLLRQARLAKMLEPSLWDFDKACPIMWEPEYPEVAPEEE